MGGFAFARFSVRVVACVLALGAAEAAAQQAQTGNTPENSGGAAAAAGGETVKSPEPGSAPANVPPEAGTSTLPELLVDGQKPKEVKKTAKSVAKPGATSGGTTTSEEPPAPGITYSTAPSDTGLTTFDTKNVQMRANGIGDANSFARNLPNVQDHHKADPNGGASSSNTIDTKPQKLSISGGRTYENNFILNGVSITNITGPEEQLSSSLRDRTAPDGMTLFGQSAQTVYVPAEFIGSATIIDSYVSAEFGQFLGGVVLYDLAAPPTDRYHASVSASRETSDYSTYLLATPNGTNPNNVLPPSYVKNTLSASLGAPLTKDFSFIVQASRKEAESSKQKLIQVTDRWAFEDSDNVFLRFAATARTDIGKFTLDTSRTDYYQHWGSPLGTGLYMDVNTHSTSTKLEHEARLPGVRLDDVGLGGVKLTSRAYYNTSETQNNSDGNQLFQYVRQQLRKVPPTSPWTTSYEDTSISDYCRGVNPATYQGATSTLACYGGGYGNTLQGQDDFGAQTTLAGDVLLGKFRVGAEIKQYEGHRARTDDWYQAGQQSVYDGNTIHSIFGDIPATPGFEFNCDGKKLCSPSQFAEIYYLYGKFDNTAVVNALHNFVELDQTWQWFNVRAGARLDYDDYQKHINIAPRLVGTITPFEGLSVTSGYNRYYLGETLYYALRDKQPDQFVYMRYFDGVGISDPEPACDLITRIFKSDGLNTPYADEYTGALSIADPLLGGQLRFRYLERYSRDQFATVSCGTACFTENNDGSKFYRSASAEYTKEWSGLNNSISLDAAAISGSVTWSERKQGKNTYLLSSDLNGDGSPETSRIWYNGKSYRPEEFDAITGNLDIPVRFGATLATVWFNDILELNASAGINLGFQGVYNTGKPPTPPVTPAAIEYVDKQFGATLKLDVSGRINVTEQAAIDFRVDNITNSDQNLMATDDNPWVLGRTYWIGSGLRF